MGDSILSTVRKAAKLAVYELIMMRVKNHHMPATIRVEIALVFIMMIHLKFQIIDENAKLFFLLLSEYL